MKNSLEITKSKKAVSFKPLKATSFSLLQGDDGTVSLKGEFALRSKDVVVEIKVDPEGEVTPLENPKTNIRKFPSTPNGVVKRVYMNVALPAELKRFSVFVRDEVSNVRALAAEVEPSYGGKPSEALLKLKNDAFLLTRETPKLRVKVLGFRRKLNTFSLQDQACIEASEIRTFLTVVMRHRANKAAHMIAEVRKKHIANGRRDLFDEFEAHMLGSIHPYVPTNHGYNVTFNNIEDQDAIWKKLKSALDELEAMGYPCFINSGTLLGAYRDGRFIDHDDDVDIGVIVPGNSVEEVVSSWFDFEEKLISKKWINVEKTKKVRNIAIFKLNLFDGILVDLFPAWIIEDEVYVWPHTNGTIQKNDVLPLISSEMFGLKMPANPEKMLEQNYGEKWKTPDPYHKFSWLKAKKKFHKFLNLVEERAKQ